MSWIVRDGSGRATCRICRELIKKEERQVTFKGGFGANGISESVHLDCLIYYDKIQVLEKLKDNA